MKKIILILSIIFSLSLINAAQAQVNVSVNINSQPAWGPTGYDNANYYYFPDLNVYFDVNNTLFYYLSGSKWVSNRYLPNKYANNDLYSMHKVVINNSSTPWKNNQQHQKEYSNYKNNNKQGAIKNSSDSRYDQSKKNTLAWVNTSQSSNSKDKNSSKTNSSNKRKNNKNRSSNSNQNNNDRNNNR